MNDQLISLLVVLATVFGVGMTIPQVVRIQRSRDFEGLSGVWIGVGMSMNVWWVLYGWQTELWGIIPVSAGGFVLYLAMAIQSMAFRGRSSLRSITVGIVGLGSFPLAFLIGAGWEVAGLVIGLGYYVQFAPAVVSSFRTRTPSGISPATWSMALAEALIWLVYAIDASDMALVVGGGGGSLMALLILARLAWLHRNDFDSGIGSGPGTDASGLARRSALVRS